MKKKILVKPRNKDFLEFIKEKLEGKVAWIYIDKATIVNLGEQCEGLIYRDTNYKLHIPYGNVVVDGYSDIYVWNRICSIDSDSVCYRVPSDPDEIFFITIKD